MEILVMAVPDDSALRVLTPPPEGVHLTVAWELADLLAAAPRADVLVVCSAGRDRVEPVFRAAPRLAWIHCLMAGVDAMLFPALVESEVPLTNAKGAYSRSLAEWVMGAVLFFAKDLRRLVRSQERGVWDAFDPEWIYRKTMGIIGYGDIGRAVAERARAFGMNVLAVRRRPASDPLCDEVVGPDRQRDVMARSDYVVVTLPLTPETRGAVGAEQIAALKRDAVFINIGRGPAVAEAPLIEALQNGRLRGAALDVFEQEPLPPGHPFYSLPNVLLSPHTADRTPGWREDSMRLFLDNLGRFRRGEPLANVVDKRLGY
jgi:phosphoglycerate dehydrogenase-like enzyme